MSRSLIDEMADILTETIDLSESMEREGWQRTPQVQRLYERAKVACARHAEMKADEDLSQHF